MSNWPVELADVAVAGVPDAGKLAGMQGSAGETRSMKDKYSSVFTNPTNKWGGTAREHRPSYVSCL